jgi:hypothetical protein
MEKILEIALQNPNDRDLGKIIRNLPDLVDLSIIKENYNDEDLGKLVRKTAYQNLGK